MMAGVRPVSLPISSQEVTFIQRRQAELSRQINLVEQKVRSGVYSKSQGVNRKMFLKSEIDELEYLKRSRRAPGSTPFTPFKLPQAPRATGQSSKYQPTTTQSNGSTTVNSANKPYGTYTKPVNTGTAKYTIKDVPKHIGRSYGIILSDTDKKSSGGYFFSYKVASKKWGVTTYKTGYYGPVNPKTSTIKDFRNWCKINLGKEYTHYDPYKVAKPEPKGVVANNYTQNSTPRKTVKSNPYGKSYGPSVSNYERTVNAGGAKPIKYGSYYYGPKYAIQRKSWEAWNNKYVYGKPTSSYKRTPQPKPVSAPLPRKTVKSNPYGKSYGPTLSLDEIAAAGGAKPIKDGSYYYGPKYGTYRKSWEAWNNKYVYGRSTSTSAPKKTVKDNPYTYKRTSYGYGTHVSISERSKMSYTEKNKYGIPYPKETKPIKYGKYYYGPTDKKEKSWLAWNKSNGISGFEGRAVELIHKDAVKARREATLIRARRGARMDINKQVRGQRKTPNWKSIANDQEKRMIQQALTEVGLSDMPKLTEKGNRVLVQAIRTNRIENPQKRMEVGARRMSRILTDLINNSGYFSVKHKAKVSPSFPPQVQLSEMAGIAGGFSKTRNSMQRLLRK